MGLKQENVLLWFYLVLPIMNNATLKLVLWEHKKDTAGKMPLMLRVTIDRNVSYIKTSLKLFKKEWNGTEVTEAHDHPKKANQLLRKQFSDVEAIIFNRSLEGRPITAKQVKDTYEGVNKSTDFFNYIRDLSADLSLANVEDSDTNHNKEVNRVKTFAGERLDLSEIDVLWLRKYEAHERRRGIKQNTINTTFKWLRRMIRAAYKEGAIKQNPFADYDVPRYVKSHKEYLTEPELTELKKLFDKPLPPPLYKTITYLIFGCYTGFRHSDWERFDQKKQVEEGFIKLRPKKTENKTNEWVIIPIGPSLRAVLNRLEKLNEPPLSNQKSNIYLKSLAAMADIDKRVTTHIGRHSFGYRCASLGIPKSTTAELLGVSEQTVEVYYHLSGANITIQAGILANI
jgi:integrase/recombinase XerD